MPQIWMTYSEIGNLLDCAADEARRIVHLENLDRKRSRDGETRVKLGRDLTALFFAKIRSAGDDLDQAIADLLRVHSLMSKSFAHEAAPDRADDAASETRVAV